jgi:hypothetical protein
MRDAARLLERNRVLLDRRQEANPGSLTRIEEELRKIDRALTRLESKEASPTAPQ